jgi:hypothetical protein
MRAILPGMGNGSNTSIYLPDPDKARWKASGLSLTDLVRRGLDSLPGADAGPLAAVVDTAFARGRDAALSFLADHGLTGPAAAPGGMPPPPRRPPPRLRRGGGAP